MNAIYLESNLLFIINFWTAHLVVLPGMFVLVQLDHIYVLWAESASAEDGVGNIPVNVNRLQSPTLFDHFKEK